MSDTIHNVTAIVGRDPNLSIAGKVNRNSEAGRESRSTRTAAPPAAKPENEGASTEAAPDVAGKISDLVKDLNLMVRQVASTKVSFDVDEATGRSVVRVVDKETGEVVRQVPPEELLTLVARMRQLSGLIFNLEA